MLKKSLLSVLFLNCIVAFSFAAFADFFPQSLGTDRMLAEFEHDFAENVDKKNNENTSKNFSVATTEEKEKNATNKYEFEEEEGEEEEEDFEYEEESEEIDKIMDDIGPRERKNATNKYEFEEEEYSEIDMISGRSE